MAKEATERGGCRSSSSGWGVTLYEPLCPLVRLFVDPVLNFTEQNPLVYRALPVSSNEI